MKSKLNKLAICFGAQLTFALVTPSAFAAITLGTSTPTAPAGGIVVTSNYTGNPSSNVTHWAVPSDYVAGDNGSGLNIHMLGQSFTTGTLGPYNQLATISAQSTAGSWANYGGSMTLRLFQVSNYSTTGGLALNQTLLGTWTDSTTGSQALINNLNTVATWFTFNLSGISLADNTTYAFTLETVGTGVNLTGSFFEWNGTGANVYAGGQAMSQDYADQPPTNSSHALWFGFGEQTSPNTTGDRVFQVTAVPEPSAVLLGGLGLLALLRRRK